MKSQCFVLLVILMCASCYKIFPLRANPVTISPDGFYSTQSEPIDFGLPSGFFSRIAKFFPTTDSTPTSEYSKGTSSFYPLDEETEITTNAIEVELKELSTEGVINPFDVKTGEISNTSSPDDKDIKTVEIPNTDSPIIKYSKNEDISTTAISSTQAAIEITSTTTETNVVKTEERSGLNEAIAKEKQTVVTSKTETSEPVVVSGTVQTMEIKADESSAAKPQETSSTVIADDLKTKEEMKTSTTEMNNFKWQESPPTTVSTDAKAIQNASEQNAFTSASTEIVKETTTQSPTPLTDLTSTTESLKNLDEELKLLLSSDLVPPKTEYKKYVPDPRYDF